MSIARELEELAKGERAKEKEAARTADRLERAAAELRGKTRKPGRARGRTRKTTTRKEP